MWFRYSDTLVIQMAVLLSQGYVLVRLKHGKVNELDWLLNVTCNDNSVIYAGGLKKKFDLWSGSQRHRHFVGFLNVPIEAPKYDELLATKDREFITKLMF